MTQLSASGESERAIEAGLRILRLEPLHEATVRSLMRLYGESGRRATAVELYRTHVDALRKELGAQPEAETRAVFTEISRGSEERQSLGRGRHAALCASFLVNGAAERPSPEAMQQFSPSVSVPDGTVRLDNSGSPEASLCWPQAASLPPRR